MYRVKGYGPDGETLSETRHPDFKGARIALVDGIDDAGWHRAFVLRGDEVVDQQDGWKNPARGALYPEDYARKLDKRAMELEDQARSLREEAAQRRRRPGLPKPDGARCRSEVKGRQCRRKRGHGPFNDYCRTHARAVEAQALAA